MREVFEYVRAGNGPPSVELDTERFYGHFEGDPQRYRGPGEVDRLREERDCLKAFRQKVSDRRSCSIIAALDADRRRDDGDTDRRSRRPKPSAAAPNPTQRSVLDRRLRFLLKRSCGPMAVMMIRDAINQTIHAEMERNPDVVVLGEDIVGGQWHRRRSRGDRRDLGSDDRPLCQVWRRPGDRHADLRKRDHGRGGRPGAGRQAARSPS